MNFLPAITLVFFLMLAPLRVAAAYPPGSAEAAAEALGNAMVAGDWDAAAALYHPDELREFRRMMQHFLASSAVQGEAGDEFVRMFFGSDRKAVAALDDAAFLAAFMKNSLFQMGGKIASSQVLGTVGEGELRHVLVRSKVMAAGGEMETLDVLSFRPSASGWRAQMKSEMKGMAAMLARLPAKP